jgi:Phage tail sheath protein subtilisin-like domain/Phage tail sheath C-terminal domain
MAETLISPGVFLNENDQSQITQGPITAGAAIIGPTVLGPVNNPTLVTSYSQYKQIFGSTFVSGGITLEYLTSVAVLNYFNQGGSSLLVTRVASGSYTVATASIAALNGTQAFQLNTLSVGTIMNNAITGSQTIGLSGAIPSGSAVNVRWEVVGYNSGSGTFTLNIRRGDDYENSKTVLESWSNLSLDPNQGNFISYVIGDQYQTLTQDPSTGTYYLQNTGSYTNKSKYVYVASVNTTPNYFSQTGIPQNQFTASLPQSGSGSYNGGFGGATGPFWGSYGLAPLNMFESIPTVTSAYATPTTNIQGVYGPDYDTAISLLGNQDTYDFNVIYAPGITNQNAPSEINSLLQLSSTRGDSISVIDLVGYNQQLSTVTSAATSFDNSYGATYWPWIQIRSSETGRMNFIPPSALIPAVYEYNDKIAAEWWAPAGLNRGGLSTALQPERRLSITDRNSLYAAKVNPIATFTGVGTVVYGQKTLQAKASALDRVNVRRLLISLKRYIRQIGQTLVFEPNTQVTWNKFLNQVNPYLESVQQRQGLYAFQVIMDSTNNTPDQIDRNILVGSIYLQPTRVAEFIQLDFNILPTGATFAQ